MMVLKVLWIFEEKGFVMWEEYFIDICVKVIKLMDFGGEVL